MRSLMLFAGLILSASLAVAQNPQDQRTQEAKPALRYSFAVSGATPSKYHVANVPRFVRAIPLHRDDDYLSGSSFATQPVVDDSLGSFSIATYSFELTASYRWIETGSRLGWASVSSDRVQQNQFGTTERGSGTSLRFYEVSSKVPISFVLFGGVRLPIVKPRPSWGGLALSLGAQYEPFGTPLHFRAGWDRFNDDKVWRYIRIGKVQANGPYARLDIALGKEDGMWLSIQALQDEPDLTLKPGFEQLEIKGGKAPITVAFRVVL